MAAKIITLNPQSEGGIIQPRQCAVVSTTVPSFRLDNSHNCYGMDVDGSVFWYTTEEARRTDHERVIRARNGGGNMFQGIKKYVEDNRDLIYTVALVAVVDQLLFEGAFRERIKKLVDGFLAKAEAKTAAGA